MAIYARLCGAAWRWRPRPPLCWGALLLTLPLLLAAPVAMASIGAGPIGLLQALATLLIGLLLHLGLDWLGRGDRLALPPLDRLPDLLGSLGLVGAGLLVAMAAATPATIQAGVG